MRLLTNLSVRLSGELPDQEMLERDQRRRERFPALQGVETVFMWIAILLLGAAVYTAFFGPSFF